MSWKLKKRCLDHPRREEGCVRKVWGDALTVCLAYPNVYRTGMSNLGFQAVYALINRHPACLCERVFLPDPGDEAAHGASAAPLFSLESQRPLADFDIVAFSLSFENDYPNILQILEMAGIPLEAAGAGRERPARHRRRHRRHPEPRTPRRLLRSLSPRRRRGASPRFPRRWRSPSAGDSPREAFLARIQKEIAGAYVPRFYRVTTEPDGRIAAREPLDAAFPRRIVRRSVPDLDAFATEQAITTEDDRVRRHVPDGGQPGVLAGAAVSAPPASSAGRPVSGAPRSWRTPSGRGLEKGKTIGLLGTAVSDHPRPHPPVPLDPGRGRVRGRRLPPPGPAERTDGGAPEGDRRGDRLPRPRGGLPAPPGCDPQGDLRRGDLFRSGQSHGI